MNDEHTHDTCNCSFTPEKEVGQIRGRDWRATILVGTTETGAHTFGAQVVVRDQRRANEANEFKIWSYDTADEATVAAVRHAAEDLAAQRKQKP
jgi:hypothetical protein